jgi:hypothetical protein
MFLKSLPQKLKKKETRFVIATLITTVAVAAISAYFHLTWRSGFCLAVGMYIALGWFAFRQNDLFLKRLLLFGIAGRYGRITGRLLAGKKHQHACVPNG